jgi:hypothetical protein
MSKNLRLNTMAEFEALKNRTKDRGKALSYNPVGQNPPNKFHAVKTQAAGIKFSTKKEAKFYMELLARKQLGEFKYILRQIPFDLPGHYDNGKIIRHFVDFAVCQKDDTFLFIEVKGRDLSLGKLKRKQTEEIYNIKIMVV